MLQIRKADGTVIPVPPDGHFVELVNDVDGTIGTVFFQSGRGEIIQIIPGSMDAQNYERVFQNQNPKVVFSKSMVNKVSS